MIIDVYSDGSATTSDRPGGYGFVVVINGKVEETGSGYLPLATNNDAELEAAIQGLNRVLELIEQALIPSNPNLTLVSDSQLILGWASGAYRFKQESKIHKYNELRKLVDTLQAKTRWVQGHSGDRFNEMCDKLANAARLQKTFELDKESAKTTGETLIGAKKTGIVCIWYKDQMKIIDLDLNIVEDYDRKKHGNRGSMLEIREEKSR